MQRFTDKVVLVTGAGSGIGKASALRIAAEGGAVFCVDLNRRGSRGHGGRDRSERRRGHCPGLRCEQ